MRLVFVYNAGKGWFNAFTDSIHKVVSPRTYPCDLCSLTHGLTRMRPEIRRYLTEFNGDTVFYHLNDLPDNCKKPLADAGGAPALFLEYKDEMLLLFDKTELSRFESATLFIAELKRRLEDILS
ncbi:hypothetical protein E7Z59_00755 [Robertkochia marina]|uniref:GTPase n=1 Tax=Robertkochia marina TaxID=1227945 RepID=A0A4S3M1D0_9FLAO|nr:hypothetical protein [Robertkochia marina]THD68892.1 hypothetical protein E7Z59_00755 [Robertkochia marina]TRZ41139.1 hypothetical protein D3A96_14035 [Robertkochia marina]